MSSTHRSKDDYDTERESDGSSGLARFHAEINRVADEFFYRLGHWVATFPKRTLAIGLVCVALCCTGFLNFVVESSADDLWVPAESLSRSQEEVVLTYFDEGFKYAVILLEHPDTEGSVLTKESLDIFWELNAETLRVETKEGHHFADLCLLDFDGESCAQPLRGVARFWGGSFAVYNATVRSDADVLSAVNVPRFPDGGAVSLAAIFGNSLTFDDDMLVTSAKVMTQSYEVAASLGVDDEYGEVYEWEGLFQDRMRKKAEEIESLNVAYFTGRSMDDSLAESVSGEVFLFVVTYAIMVIFVMMGLGRCRSGAVERRSWLGFGGVCIVVASGLAAYGINSGFGVPFTSLSQILPFILVGIGVDDMFVMLASFDHTNPTLPVEERMAVALRRSGVSITYSSLTNFSAFMLGSFTVLPAVEYFCLYAGTAILFDFILQVTAFPALLVMDTNRQIAGRLDWCCCFTSAEYLKERAETGASLPIADEECPPPPIIVPNKSGPDRHRNHQDANSSSRPARAAGGPAGLAVTKARSTAFKRKGGEERSDVHHLTGLGRWMKDVYAPFLLSAKGKALVLLSFAGLLIAGIYGVAEVTQGFNVLDVAPDEHFARTYKELAIGYALDQDSQFVPLAIYTPAVDYADIQVQSVIQGTDALMVNQQHFSGPVNSWLTSFTKWAENNTEYRGNIGSVYGFKVYNDRPTFYSALAAFTSDGDSAAYLSDLSFSDSGEIEMSRSSMYLVDLTTTASSVDAINSARKVISLSPLKPTAFAYSPLFVYFEQYLVIYKELVTNFLLALAAVAVLSLLVLGRFRIVVLVCFTVVMIDIELLGFVHHWGLQVNGITVIELIMAVGLVVDYMVHIVHYYLLQDPEIEKELRIGRALGEIGPSVTIGAATTFLGIMPMAFASNSIFRVFFKMFIVIIIFGYVHGVIFIPVALSLLPDSSVVRYLASGDGGREAVGAEVKEEEADPMGLHFAIAAAAAAAAAETKLHVCVVCSAAAQVPGEVRSRVTNCNGNGGGGGCGCRGDRDRGSSVTSSERRRRGGGGVATVAPGCVAGEGRDGFGASGGLDGGRGGGGGGSGTVGGGGGGSSDGRVTPEDGSRSSFDGDGYSSFSHTTLSSLSAAGGGGGDKNCGGVYVGGGRGGREIDEAHRMRAADGFRESGSEAGGHEGEHGGDRKLNDRIDVVHYSLSNDNRRLGPRFRAEQPRRESEQPPSALNLGSRSESNNSLARFESRSSSVSTLNSLAWSSSMLSRNSSLVSATNSLFATGPIYPAPRVVSAVSSAPSDVQQQQKPSRSPLSSSAMMRHHVGKMEMDPAIHRWSLQQPQHPPPPPPPPPPARAAMDHPMSPEPSNYTEMPMERREGFKMWPSKKTRQTVVPWTWQVD